MLSSHLLLSSSISLTDHPLSLSFYCTVSDHCVSRPFLRHIAGRVLNPAGLQKMPSKADIIEERKANLPLPDDPPAASDFNSLDERTVNVGPGAQSADLSSDPSSGLREPATGPSAARVDGETSKVNTAGLDVGRTAKEALDGLPNDAVTRDKKDAKGLADTTGRDYGYPEKNDPSSGVK